LTLNAGTGAVTGTPTSDGASNFTIQATDAIGNGGNRNYTVNISTVTIAVSPAALPNGTLGVPYSQTVNASGGTAPYAYTVTSGALPAGLSLNTSTGAITGTPTASAPANFTIRATDAVGNSGAHAYSLLNRPDPALDPEVVGLVNAQIAVARRFASTQIENVSRHLESLHNRFESCSVNFGVSLPPPTVSKSTLYGASPEAAARSYEPPPNSPAAQIARRMPGSPECAGGWASSFAAWVSGAVQFGSGTPDGLTSQNRFSTSGLTAGIDWRATESLIVGAALGYGTDRTNIGSNTTRSDATSISATIYASYKPFDPLFVDAVIGYGQLNYDNRRWVANDPTTVAGTRKGGYWFGAVTTSYELKYGALRVAPYMRADFMSAQLNSYSEQGSGAELLTYGAMGFHTLAGTAGLRGSYDILVSWGVFTPTARVEYGRALDGAFQQSTYYTDLGASMTSTLTQASASRDLVNANFGFRARSFGGMTAELEYGASSSSASFRAQTIRGALRLPF
jgi:uncharacterized protein YhjY with autotransporter beta-barrel domain